MSCRPSPRPGFGRPRAAGALVVATIALLAWSAAPARAADELTPTGRRAVIEIGLPKRTPSASDSVPHPWPGRAVLLSAAGTALPLALLTGADHDESEARVMAVLALEVVTPSAGHFYGGLPRRALIGIGVRAAAGALVANALSSDSHEFDWSVVMALGGAAVIGVSALVDVVSVSGDIERANRERFASRVSLGMRPLPSGRVPAWVLTARF